VQEHPRRSEGDRLPGSGAVDQPANGLGGDRDAVLVPQQVLEDHLEGERQAFRAWNGVQPPELVTAGVAESEPSSRAEAVEWLRGDVHRHTYILQAAP
jgi:hypothetical protein